MSANSQQRPQPVRPAARPAPRSAKRSPFASLDRAVQRLTRLKKRWWLLLGGGALVMFMMLCAGIGLGIGLIYAGGDILNGVHVGGVDVGGQSEAEAASTLANQWQQNGILLADGERTWIVMPADLGIQLDANASAAAAHAYGRSNGGVANGIKSLFADADVEPVVTIDFAQLSSHLQTLAPNLEEPPVNAGV